MNRHIITLIICLLCQVVKATDKVNPSDSLRARREAPAYLMPAIGGGLVVAGSLIGFDHGGRTLGMDFTPSHNYKADEVLRFAPAIALVGMKALGIESRTEKWGELLVRGAASTAIMGLSVESTKRLAGRVRPDGSDDRSFPSGHTAAAFLTASLFAKEYGHLSPWYSVGAYGVATSTAMLRRINDKHWMSDVMVGAGIGILSTELGYALADLFYKPPKGLDKGRAGLTRPKAQSGLYMQYTLPHALAGAYGGKKIRSRLGYSAGWQAGYLLAPCIGVEGRMGITSSLMEVNDEKEGYKAAEEPLDHVSVAIGPCVTLPLGKGFSTSAHLHGGYGFYPQANLAGIRLEASQGWGCEGGIAIGYTTHERVCLQLVAGYHAWEPPATGMDNQGFSLGISAGWGW